MRKPMIRRLLFLLLAFAICSPAVSWAADGDELIPREQHRSIHLLCDSKAAANEGETCTIFPVGSSPYAMWIGTVNATNCTTAWEVAILGSATNGGDTHTIATLGGGAGDDSAVSIVSHLPKYVTVSLTTMTSCTDFDLAIDLKSRNR